ncbi:hypothetical protein QQ045_016440 [Rhodiola kirilowii]
MASACVNNVGVTPGKFSSYGWLSPRVSFTRDDEAKSSKGKATTTAAAAAKETAKEREKVCYKADLENGAADFEFRLDDPVAMLPADELISDGKLMPMMLFTTVPKQPLAAEARLPETARTRRITEVLSSGVDPYLFSPKAPRCTSRWKEILGLKKLRQNSVNNNEVKSSSASTNKSLKNFLQHRNSKSSSSDTSGLSLPLLRESDYESLSMSSRLSLSSSSSGHELEDFPRLSLDAEKQNINPISLLKSVANSNPNNPNPPPRVRLVKPRPAENGGPRMGKSRMRRTATEPTNAAVAAASYGVSIDSPRMNPSGKIVFQSLGRSWSSPSSFNGGPRFHHSGMDRSYSANVRVAPVLNVPVCSLSKSGSVLGFGQLFSSHQKRDSNGGISRSYQSINNNNNSRNRTDRN